MADSSTSTMETRSKKKKSSKESKKKKKTELQTKESTPPPPETSNEAAAKDDSPTRNTGSPDPNCSICLGKLENKSFTDSCFHMFCFVCLLEWSKVKNECPLCKQSFKSIIHNVRSYEDYDQYHLAFYNRTHSPEHPYSRSFRYRTTLTEDRVFNLRNRVIGNPNTDPETVLQLQAVGEPRDLHLRFYDYARQNYNRQRQRQTATSDFRRRIYTNGMRLTGIRGTGNRVRECTPAFFSRNPALTHRLVPWLNRELNALLFHQESHVQFLLELIMGLIKRFEINSEELFEHVSPFIGRHTRQFMREFEMFAKCPYCMIVYDRKAMYEQVPESVSSDDTSVNSISDDDSDVQFVSTEAAPVNRIGEYVTLPDIISEVQVSSSMQSPRLTSSLQNSGWHSPTPGPSWSFDPVPSLLQRDFIPSLKRSVGFSNADVDSDLESLSSAGSEVMVVAYDKPWEERSPINLSSESDIEENLPKESKEKKPKVKKQKKKKTSHSKDHVSSASVNPPSSTVGQIADTSERQLEETTSRQTDKPSTSRECSHRRKSKHKSKSWRDSNYKNKTRTLFHRRSTSPEMMDGGVRGTDSEFAAEHRRERRKRKHKHARESNSENWKITSTSEAIQEDLARYRPDPQPSADTQRAGKRRRESRSPSIEIISIHHKKKKKHKKHKHRHSHKEHTGSHSKKLKSAVVLVENQGGGNPSQEDTDAYEDGSQTESQTTTPPSVTSSTRTSEVSGSSRSFTDTICDTLNPVEIASNIAAQKAPAVDPSTGGESVFDLTAVNLEQVDDDDLMGSLASLDSASTNKGFKKHPTGHKGSSANTSLSMQSALLPSLPPIPNVMLNGDPLLNQGPTFFSNVLENFEHAFSGFNPHAWYRRSMHSMLASTPNFQNPWMPSLSAPSLASPANSYPLDMRQMHFPGRSMFSNRKPSTVTSSQTNTIVSDDDSSEDIISPRLDVVNVGSRRPNILSNNLPSSSRNLNDCVINISGTDDSSSDSQFIDSTQDHKSNHRKNSISSSDETVIGGEHLELDLVKSDDENVQSNITQSDQKESSPQSTNSETDLNLNSSKDANLGSNLKDSNKTILQNNAEKKIVKNGEVCNPDTLRSTLETNTIKLQQENQSTCSKTSEEACESNELKLDNDYLSNFSCETTLDRNTNQNAGLDQTIESESILDSDDKVSDIKNHNGNNKPLITNSDISDIHYSAKSNQQKRKLNDTVKNSEFIEDNSESTVEGLLDKADSHRTENEVCASESNSNNFSVSVKETLSANNFMNKNLDVTDSNSETSLNISLSESIGNGSDLNSNNSFSDNKDSKVHQSEPNFSIVADSIDPKGADVVTSNSTPLTTKDNLNLSSGEQSNSSIDSIIITTDNATASSVDALVFRNIQIPTSSKIPDQSINLFACSSSESKAKLIHIDESSSCSSSSSVEIFDELKLEDSESDVNICDVSVSPSNEKNMELDYENETSSFKPSSTSQGNCIVASSSQGLASKPIFWKKKLIRPQKNSSWRTEELMEEETEESDPSSSTDSYEFDSQQDSLL